jgi:hypothetical protein
MNHPSVDITVEQEEMKNNDTIIMDRMFLR